VSILRAFTGQGRKEGVNGVPEKDGLEEGRSNPNQ